MSTHHSGSGGHGRAGFRTSGDIFNRVPGGARATGAGIVLALVVLIAIGVARGRRVAVWAPVDVVESTDPLQELPIRVAAGDEPVRPAQTYDAVLDLSSVRSLVVGVDLDYVPKGASRYDAVIRDLEGTERFRDRIAESYFAEGRFMLRLLSGRFPAGDYTLEIESFAGTNEGRVIAASWFQILR